MATLTPFLYPARVLQRLPRPFLHPAASKRLFHATPLRTQRKPGGRRPARELSRSDRDGEQQADFYESIPFDIPDDVQFTEKDSKDFRNPEPGRSTITPTERSAFNRIFEEIAARGAASAPRPDSEGGAQPRDGIVIVQGPPRGSAKRDRTFTATDRAEAIESFPPSLRKAAGMAFSLEEEGGAHAQESMQRTSDEANTLQEAEAGEAASEVLAPSENDRLRHQEQTRIEAKMSEARTDFELWDVMEAEVFSLVKKLGLKRSRRREQDASNMDIYGPLYPALLLHGLRLLDTAFEHSSPLVFSVLPRVKGLGLSSYVLGASTAFYNTLMGVLWRRHNDAAAVVSLWDEMHHAGLPYDADSLCVLVEARDAILSSAEGSRGPFLERVMAAVDLEDGIQIRIRRCQRRDGIALSSNSALR